MAYIPKREGRVTPFRPNWENGIDAEIEFKTNVVRFRDGTEQRSILRAQPRFVMEYETQIHRGQLHRVMADLNESQHYPFVVPFPWRYAVLAEDVEAGATEIEVVQDKPWMAAGMTLILDNGAISQEAFTATDVLGTTINVSGSIDYAIPAGSRVRFAGHMRLSDSLTFNAITTDAVEGKVEYSLDPADGFTFYSYTPDTFEDIELFTRRPNWRETPRLDFLEEREIIDHGIGVIQTSSPTNFMQERVRFAHMARNASEIEELLAFFGRRKGKAKPFYMPTWQRDFVAHDQPSATAFDVERLDGYAGFTGSEIYNVIAAIWPDGTIQPNRVVSVTTAGTQTRFTCTDSWDYTIDENTYLCWCPLWRLDTDMVQPVFHAEEVMEMNLTALALRNNGGA